MIVSDLIEKLKKMPQDASVELDLEAYVEHYSCSPFRLVNVWLICGKVVLETK
jgi:hypothetical protein